MKGPFGYGRYDDGHIGCPRAKSDMTPCVARDGQSAVDDGGVCVGCGRDPVDLLVELVRGASAMESRRMFEGGVEREAWVVMAVFTASLSPEHEPPRTRRTSMGDNDCNCGDPEAAWGHLQTCPLYQQHGQTAEWDWDEHRFECPSCGEPMERGPSGAYWHVSVADSTACFASIIRLGLVDGSAPK